MLTLYWIMLICGARVFGYFILIILNLVDVKYTYLNLATELYLFNICLTQLFKDLINYAV